MAAITFPSSPSVNDTFTVSGKSWTWTGTVWQANATTHAATHTSGGADELSPEAIGAASIEELSAHTGSASAHSVATISGLSDALAGKQAAGEYATAAQGALAESALQEAAAFATSAQGVKADSALQPGTPIASISGLQTELDGKQNAGAFATADQGGKADSAVQIVDGTISVPAPDGGRASIGPVDGFGGMCSLRSFNAYGQTYFVIYSPDGSAALFTSFDGGIFRIQAATKAQITSSSSGDYSLPLEVGMFVSQLGRNQGSPIAWDTISAFQGNGRIVTTAETEQFRLAYDAENYLTITVGPTGIATFEAVGSAAGFAGVATASQGAKADSALQAESDPVFSAWLEMAKADGDDSLQAGYANYVGNITSANWSDLRSIFSVLAQGDGTSSLTNDSGFLTDATAFASAAQGALADTALQPSGDGSQLTGILKPDDLNHVTVEQANNATHAVDSQTAWRADTAIAVESLSGHNVSELTNDTGFLSDASAFATSAQGALADTALQDASAFATAAQGALVDAFVNGTTMVEGSNYADYANHATPGSPLESEIAGKATSEQGAKADSALQPRTLIHGLLAHWNLNETSGPRRDSHGSYDLIENGSVGYASGNLGNAASFDGVATYLSAPSFSYESGSSLSVSSWFNVRSHNAYSGIVTMWGPWIGDAQGPFMLGLIGGAIEVDFTDVSLSGEGSAHITDLPHTISVGSWYHLIFSWDETSKTAKIYLNGALVSTFVSEHSLKSGTNSMLQIGASESASTGILDGLVDSVSIWNRALTDIEVTSLFNSGAGLDYNNFSLDFGPLATQAEIESGIVSSARAMSPLRVKQAVTAFVTDKLSQADGDARYVIAKATPFVYGPSQMLPVLVAGGSAVLFNPSLSGFGQAQVHVQGPGVAGDAGKFRFGNALLSEQSSGADHSSWVKCLVFFGAGNNTVSGTELRFGIATTTENSTLSAPGILVVIGSGTDASSLRIHNGTSESSVAFTFPGSCGVTNNIAIQWDGNSVLKFGTVSALSGAFTQYATLSSAFFEYLPWTNEVGVYCLAPSTGNTGSFSFLGVRQYPSLMF